MKIKINLSHCENVYQNVNKFLKVVTSFESNFNMIKGSYVIDAKSPLGIYSIDISKIVEVEIVTNDKNEQEKFIKEMEEFK